MKDSIFKVFLKSLGILSPSQMRNTRIQVVYSLTYALLELLSVAALIPLVAQLDQESTTSFWYIPIHHLNDHLLLLIIVIAAIFLVKNLIIVVISSKQAHFIGNISTELSLQLFKKFYNQNWLDYIQNNTEDFIRKIKEVPSDFAHHVLQNLIRILTDTLTGIILIVFLSLTEPRTIYVLIGMVAPVLVIYQIFKKTVVQNINKSFREITPTTSAVLAQSVDSFMEAKLYSKEDFFLKKYTILRKNSSDYLSRLKAASYIPALFFEVVGILVILGLLYYTSQSGNKSETMQLIALVVIAVYKIFPILNRILNGIVQVMSYRYTVNELTLATVPKDVTPLHEKIPFINKIELSHLSFTYPNKKSHFKLVEINLEINKGDFIVITGPSGSGKTTLLNLLTGLIDGYSGEIKIDGTSISAEKFSWNTNLSLVPQAPVILQDTIRNNIAFGTNTEEISDSLVISAAKDAVIFDFIQELPEGLDTPLGENGLTISGGQRQCLALARALYNQPKILLIDEPTNQLDEDKKKKLLQSLKNRQSNGLTIILATHDLISLNYCTKHVELRNGSIQNMTNH